MIPDDEPWWMVRANTGLKLATEAAISNYREGMPSTCPMADALADEPASETERALDSLDFRPIGYEW